MLLEYLTTVFQDISTFCFTSYQTYHIDLINMKSSLKEMKEKVREVQRMM